MTYVEITDRSQLTSGTAVLGLALAIADSQLLVVSDIMARIGVPHGWLSSRRTPQEWQAWFAERQGRTS